MAVTNIVQENNASERLQQSKNGIELRNKVKKGDPNNSHSGSGGNDETPPPIPPHRTPVGSRPKSAMSIDRIDQPTRFVTKRTENLLGLDNNIAVLKDFMNIL